MGNDGLGFRVVDCGSWIVGRGLRIDDVGCGLQMWEVDCGLWIVECGLMV